MRLGMAIEELQPSAGLASEVRPGEPTLLGGSIRTPGGLEQQLGRFVAPEPVLPLRLTDLVVGELSLDHPLTPGAETLWGARLRSDTTTITANATAATATPRRAVLRHFMMGAGRGRRLQASDCLASASVSST